MAELTHDASRPTSTEPAGIAPQASGSASSDKGKLRVFISYSREDLKFADQLDEALKACSFECFIDRQGISGGEEWKRRLGDLISEADTVVFVLSPSSAGSPTCVWEVDEAARLNKRIFPVICRPLEGVSPTPRLRDLNYMFFYEEPKVLGSGFGNGLGKLVTALNTDFDWLREHTRYLQRAMEWDKGGRAANRLLSGNDILDAKAWVARRPKGAPEPTALHLDFIRASEEEAEARLSEQRKQFEAMAAAQTERETALHEREEALKQTAEALKQAADAQRKRARIRNIALVVVSILGVFAGSLGWLANQQRITAQQERAAAEQQREQADAILASATKVITKLHTEMDIDTRKDAFAVYEAGSAHGDSWSMNGLGLYYAWGHGVAQDYTKAREWFEKAAAKGNPRAMSDLAEIYLYGNGVAQDYTKAREWFEKAAANGDAIAMNHLGVIYGEGQGVAQDYTKEREWYEKAAVNGVAQAMFNLGLIYEMGQGVAQDHAKGREWFEKAAAKNDADAMFNLGVLYHKGQGVAQDYTKEREWYERAAAVGSTKAMFFLGRIYANGQGVAQDYTKAREWYEEAAAGDNADAMIGLGALYGDGLGVPQDYAKAREWLEKAAAMNNSNAKMALELLPIREAAKAGRYPEALQLQEAWAAKVETVETNREGRPGNETARALNAVAWAALFARAFPKALSASNRAHTLLPENLSIETNRAHALMFSERGDEAKALYVAYRGKPLSEERKELWESVIINDFAEFRKVSLTHPMMADIEKELGVSR